MKCRICDNEFEPKHFNSQLCSDECRAVAKRQVKARFKASDKGADAERRWRANPAKKEIDKRYMQTENAKRLAVIRSRRALQTNEYLQERKRERDKIFGRTEYGRELNRKAKRKYDQTPQGKAARKNGKARRRGRVDGARITANEWAIKLSEFNGRCAFCKSTDRIEQDHIIPLSRGGKHEIDNVRPLCRKCNAKKSNHLDSELPASIVRPRSNM